MPSPQTPFSTAPMLAKHFSPIATTSNRRFKCPNALKTHYTYCHHLQPPYPMPPCPPSTFHLVPPPQNPFSTARLLAKHISPSAITSNPVCNCPHAVKIRFTRCHHLKPGFQLALCLRNTFRLGHHLDHPFQLPACLQNTSYPVSAHLKNHFQPPPYPANSFHPLQPP